jgi:hypothetical protein
VRDFLTVALVLALVLSASGAAVVAVNKVSTPAEHKQLSRFY